MFNKIRISISKPGLLFAFIKDKKRQIIGYLLLMALLMTLPVIITAIKDPKELFPSNTLIENGINQTFNNNDLRIDNGELNNPNEVNRGFIAGEYLIFVGESLSARNGIIVHFETNDIKIYVQLSSLVRQEIASISYEEANISDITFNSQNNNRIANAVVNLLSKQGMLVYTNVLTNFIFNMIQYLFIALIFTLLFRITNQIPLNFGSSFKLSFYLTTMWALITLILALFGLSELTFIAYIFVYINHIRAFRSISIIRKIQVGKKDE